jgi:diguanylate cyclase (GGDEF)-like protein
MSVKVSEKVSVNKINDANFHQSIKQQHDSDATAFLMIDIKGNLRYANQMAKDIFLNALADHQQAPVILWEKIKNKLDSKMDKKEFNLNWHKMKYQVEVVFDQEHNAYLVYVLNCTEDYSKQKFKDKQVEIAKHSALPICIVDAQGVVVTANDEGDRVYDILKLNKGQKVSKQWHAYIQQALKEGKEIEANINFNETPLNLKIVPNADNTQVVCYTIGPYSFKDIPQFDHVTGLYNRLAMCEYIHSGWLEWQFYNEIHSFLFIEVDGFRKIEGSLGHEAGYAALKTVTQRILNITGDQDFICRMGENDFAILLKNNIDHKLVSKLCEKLIKAIEVPFTLETINFELKSYIAVTQMPMPQMNTLQILPPILQALDIAKSKGGSNYHIYTEKFSSEKVTRPEVIRNLLPLALAKKEMYVHYQPIWSISEKKYSGCEALLRWENPQLGNVPPNEFIAIAEKTGEIKKLGQWVLSQVVEFIESNENLVPFVSLNVSPLQLYDRKFIQFVDKVLANTKVKPSQLVFEVTESLVLDDNLQGLDRLHEIRERGIHIAIDDFGTGYATLQSLDMLHPEHIKIDRHFTEMITSNRYSCDIINYTIKLAHQLGMKVIAEGIEDIRQYRYYESLDCDMIQGFYLSKPLSGEDAVKLIDNKRVPQELHNYNVESLFRSQ